MPFQITLKLASGCNSRDTRTWTDKILQVPKDHWRSSMAILY